MVTVTQRQATYGLSAGHEDLCTGQVSLYKLTCGKQLMTVVTYRQSRCILLSGMPEVQNQF